MYLFRYNSKVYNIILKLVLKNKYNAIFEYIFYEIRGKQGIYMNFLYKVKIFDCHKVERS